LALRELLRHSRGDCSTVKVGDSLKTSGGTGAKSRLSSDWTRRRGKGGWRRSGVMSVFLRSPLIFWMMGEERPRSPEEVSEVVVVVPAAGRELPRGLRREERVDQKVERGR